MQSTRLAAAFDVVLAAAESGARWPWGTRGDDYKRKGSAYAFGRHFGRYLGRVDSVSDTVTVAVRSERVAAVAAHRTLHAFTSDGAVEKMGLSGRGRVLWAGYHVTRNIVSFWLAAMALLGAPTDLGCWDVARRTATPLPAADIQLGAKSLSVGSSGPRVLSENG